MYDVSMIDGHIDEPKMTDNEIIKAVGLCNGIESGRCDECSYRNTKDGDCVEILAKDTIDLINRQKAEIERLRETLDATIAGQETLQKNLPKVIKAEAYKECIGKVKEEINEALKSNYKVRAERESRRPYSYLDCNIWNYCNGKIDCLRGLDYFLDDLLKEKVGEE